MDQAACIGIDPRVFFPDNPQTLAGKKQSANARAICARCPVTEPCLEAGLAEEWGIWGGVDASERGRMARRAAREKAKARHLKVVA
jgi:WhiB family redox-sensing transcriptional regulator